VARDRKRAKQRRARRGRDDATAPVGRSAGRPDPAGAANGGSGGSSSPGGSPSGGSPVRADVPGALDHASGDVDEFDAAIVRGAGGVPADAGAVPADLDGVAADPETLSEPEIEAEAESEGDLTEDEIQELAGGSTGSGGGRAGGGGGAGGALSAPGGGGSGGGATPEQASGAPVRGGNRAIGFLRASWAELQRVQWPDRRQVFQATAVVLGFVAIAGAYLGLADYVAKEIVEIIL
jgi:preprotein translocase subunit SecE